MAESVFRKGGLKGLHHLKISRKDDQTSIRRISNILCMGMLKSTVAKLNA